MTRPLEPTRALACAHESKPLLPSAPMTTTVCPARARAAALARARRRRRAPRARRFRRYRPEAAPKARFQRESPCRAPRRARSRRRRASTASMCSGVSVSETSDAMRSPTLEIDLVAQRLADLEHAADEHAAAAGDGIVLLAALANDLDDVLADSLARRSRSFARSA